MKLGNTDTYRQPELLIGGDPRGLDGRDAMPVVNPATGGALCLLPLASRQDLDDALEAAQRSFTEWRRVAPVDRGRILRRAADLMRGSVERIARLITLEVGKPIAESRQEAALAAETLDWFAEEGRRAYGRILPSGLGKTQFMVVKEPVGPVAAFAPWNFPTVNAARKIGSALAAGCPCILKPAEEAPAAALEVARALLEAGLPRGVLSVVFGVPAEVSEHLLASPIIRKVSFTGSIPVGQHLMKLAAASGKRTTMELGGHAPVLVFGDADVEQALDLAVASKYRNAGQVCVSPTRFYIHESIHERFVQGFEQRVRTISVGDGLAESTRMGPLAHDRRRAPLESLIENALGGGGRLVSGGKAIESGGYFFEPTVLADVPESARVMNEEPFGPLALLNAFTSTDEAIARANRLPFGLAAYAFTRSTDVVRRVSHEVEAGMLGINSFMISVPDAPFLGIKESGHGAENGIEGLEACLVTKLVSVA
ncbi:MAG: NAD-dependent succinate-semialdehyde dehydrogenase [Pigmentiphaga sp.]|uniref:NAD-dependent succinate-semialdehyde dehydrogenase n=1 Tax=Pigmentiphaga sp. TaxID=1977564 RepID=UPI003B556BC7